ncbi:TPA: amidase domain-containing protein [Clostridioides difficile]|nr:amidase domain-containing protein [Clostridioides difficile]MDE3610816.1 amidase domain-containing protein [Clostridioides difficile]MDM9791816.1 amidase domain-containing protein [Clostridioides difficile]HBG7262686.1 amidase domain-containing protein [Clostridioides difficile]HBG7270187.1 amidase domain-containing protein [Clostridioides difficile]
MKSIQKLLVVLSLIFCVFMMNATAAFAQNTEKPKNSNMNQLTNQIETLLNDRASVMISDNNVIDSRTFKTRSASQENEERNLISQYRKDLADMGETYSKTKTEVEVIETTNISDIQKSIKAKEITYMTIAENGVDTGYSAEHEFIFNKDIDGNWVLTEDRQLEPTGLLPLHQAEKYVYEKSSYKNDSSSEELTTDDLIPASIDKNTVSTEEEKNTNARAGYNYNAMANYLEKYWKNYNTAYRSFKNKGGDCTNFVSQALRAGGWKDKLGLYTNANYWWYNSTNQSRSWTAVNYWATFARNSKRTTMLKNVWSCGVGDVLQVKPKNQSTKVHSMMVSYKKNGTPFFTYHSSDRYRRSLNQVLKDWAGGTFYAYRT